MKTVMKQNSLKAILSLTLLRTLTNRLSSTCNIITYTEQTDFKRCCNFKHVVAASQVENHNGAD
jgi:hypothetical protein